MHTRFLRNAIFVLLAACAALLPAQTATPASSGPSLRDTAAFIVQNVPVTQQLMARNTWEQNNPISTTISTQASTDSANACIFRYTETLEAHDALQKHPPGAPVSTTYVIDMSTLDPSSIRVLDKSAQNSADQAYMGYSVALHATNNAAAIRVEQQSNNRVEMEAAAGVWVASQDTAERLSRAFQHYITLCGGRSSLF